MRFDPPSLAVLVGQPAHVHVQLLRNGQPLAARPSDFRLGVWPDVGLRIALAGDGFDLVADRPGTFRISAEYLGGGFAPGPVGHAIVSVTAPAPPPGVLERMEIVEARTGQVLGDAVLDLAPGAQLSLRTRGQDAYGQPVRTSPTWVVSSPAAGHVHDSGRGRGVVFHAGTVTCPHTVHTLAARDCHVSAVLRFRVVGTARPVGVVRIDLVQLQPWGGSQPIGGVVYAARGSQLALAAIGRDEAGQPIAFDAQWSLSTNQLGQLYRGADGTMIFAVGRQFRGTVVLVVRDPITGAATQVQVVVS